MGKGMVMTGSTVHGFPNGDAWLMDSVDSVNFRRENPLFNRPLTMVKLRHQIGSDLLKLLKVF